MMIQTQITGVLALVNIILLAIIIALGVRSYMRMRAEYTIFVMVFAGLFLLQYLLGAYMYVTHMALYVMEVTTHMLVLSAIQTVAFAYMLWMELQ